MLRLVATTTFYFLLFSGSTLTGCPDGWTPAQGSCYRITDRPMNWHAARQVGDQQVSYINILTQNSSCCQDCGLQGGYLAEVQSEDEQVSLILI